MSPDEEVSDTVYVSYASLVNKDATNQLYLMHWKASFHLAMAQIGCCNLVVPRRHSARGLFSQASSKNIFWQNIPHKQKEKKNL